MENLFGEGRRFLEEGSRVEVISGLPTSVVLVSGRVSNGLTSVTPSGRLSPISSGCGRERGSRDEARTVRTVIGVEKRFSL